MRTDTSKELGQHPKQASERLWVSHYHFDNACTMPNVLLTIQNVLWFLPFPQNKYGSLHCFAKHLSKLAPSFAFTCWHLKITELFTLFSFLGANKSKNDTVSIWVLEPQLEMDFFFSFLLAVFFFNERLLFLLIGQLEEPVAATYF